MSEETVNFDCGVPYHENQVKKLREQRKKLIEEVEALDRSIDDQLKVIKSSNHRNRQVQRPHLL